MNQLTIFTNQEFRSTQAPTKITTIAAPIESTVLQSPNQNNAASSTTSKPAPIIAQSRVNPPSIQTPSLQSTFAILSTVAINIVSSQTVITSPTPLIQNSPVIPSTSKVMPPSTLAPIQTSPPDQNVAFASKTPILIPPPSTTRQNIAPSTTPVLLQPPTTLQNIETPVDTPSQTPILLPKSTTLQNIETPVNINTPTVNILPTSRPVIIPTSTPIAQNVISSTSSTSTYTTPTSQIVITSAPPIASSTSTSTSITPRVFTFPTSFPTSAIQPATFFAAPSSTGITSTQSLTPTVAKTPENSTPILFSTAFVVTVSVVASLGLILLLLSIGYCWMKNRKLKSEYLTSQVLNSNSSSTRSRSVPQQPPSTVNYLTGSPYSIRFAPLDSDNSITNLPAKTEYDDYYLNKEFKVQREYIANESDEVGLEIGDTVYVEQTFVDGWAIMTNMTNKKKGMGPLCMLEYN